MRELRFFKKDKDFRRELQNTLNDILENPVTNKLIDYCKNIVMILDDQLQIIAVINNTGYRKLHFFSSPFKVGDTLNCIYASADEKGCGYSEFCHSCRIFNAITHTLNKKQSISDFGGITIRNENTGDDDDNLFYRAFSTPVTIGNDHYIILFLKDITQQQKMSTMLNLFFHDLNNTLQVLSANAELLAMDNYECDKESIKYILQSALRMKDEIEIQKALFRNNLNNYKTNIREIGVKQVFDEINSMFNKNPLKNNVKLITPDTIPDIRVRTDYSILLRILLNMLKNAFEASKEGDEVRFYINHEPESIAFCVWNKQYIPRKFALKIFSKYFSTKGDLGRGLGTYSMKLFGERLLGGKVDFKTDKSEGTTFYLTLPL